MRTRKVQNSTTGFANNSKSSKVVPLSPFSLVSFGHVFLFSLPRAGNGIHINSLCREAESATLPSQPNSCPLSHKQNSNHRPSFGTCTIIFTGGLPTAAGACRTRFRTARFFPVPRTARVGQMNDLAPALPLYGGTGTQGLGLAVILIQLYSLEHALYPWCVVSFPRVDVNST